MWRASASAVEFDLVRRHHAVDEPDACRLGRRDAVGAGQDDLLGALRADQPWQDHDHDAGAEFQLRLAEHRVLGRNRDVAGERQLAAAGEAIALHRSNRRLLAMPEAHHCGKIAVEDFSPRLEAGRAGLHLLLEIEAGGKVAAGALDDERADLVVALHGIEGMLQLAEHALVDGVEPLRPRQGQERDDTGALQANGLIAVAHGIAAHACPRPVVQLRCIDRQPRAEYPPSTGSDTPVT